MRLSILLLVSLVPVINTRPRYWVLSKDREIYLNLANPPASFNPMYSKDERPGHCPSQYKPRICTGRPVDQCQYDDDCLQGSKCCKDFCYRYKVCVKTQLDEQVTQTVTPEVTSVTPQMTSDRNNIPTDDFGPQSTKIPRIPDDEDYYYIDIDDVMTLPPEFTREHEKTSSEKVTEETPEESTTKETTLTTEAAESEESTEETTEETETERTTSVEVETEETTEATETEEPTQEMTEETETAITTSVEVETEETTEETETEETTKEMYTNAPTPAKAKTEQGTEETGAEGTTLSEISGSGSGDGDGDGDDDQDEDDQDEDVTTENEDALKDYTTTPRAVSEFEFEESTTVASTSEETDHDETGEESTEASTFRVTEAKTTRTPQAQTTAAEAIEGSGSGDRIDDTEDDDYEDVSTTVEVIEFSTKEAVVTTQAPEVTTQESTKRTPRITTKVPSGSTEDVEGSGSGDRVDDNEDDYEGEEYGDEDEDTHKPRVEKEIDVDSNEEESLVVSSEDMDTKSSNVEESDEDLRTTTVTEASHIELDEASTEYFDYGSGEEVGQEAVGTEEGRQKPKNNGEPELTETGKEEEQGEEGSGGNEVENEGEEAGNDEREVETSEAITKSSGEAKTGSEKFDAKNSIEPNEEVEEISGGDTFGEDLGVVEAEINDPKNHIEPEPEVERNEADELYETDKSGEVGVDNAGKLNEGIENRIEVESQGSRVRKVDVVDLEEGVELDKDVEFDKDVEIDPGVRIDEQIELNQDELDKEVALDKDVELNIEVQPEPDLDGEGERESEVEHEKSFAVESQLEATKPSESEDVDLQNGTEINEVKPTKSNVLQNEVDSKQQANETVEQKEAVENEVEHQKNGHIPKETAQDRGDRGDDAAEDYFEEYDESLVPESRRGKEFVITIPKSDERKTETLDSTEKPVELAPPLSKMLEIEEKPLVDLPDRAKSETGVTRDENPTEISRQEVAGVEDNEAERQTVEEDRVEEGEVEEDGDIKNIVTPRNDAGEVTTAQGFEGMDEKKESGRSGEIYGNGTNVGTSEGSVEYKETDEKIKAADGGNSRDENESRKVVNKNGEQEERVRDENEFEEKIGLVNKDTTEEKSDKEIVEENKIGRAKGDKSETGGENKIGGEKGGIGETEDETGGGNENEIGEDENGRGGEDRDEIREEDGDETGGKDRDETKKEDEDETGGEDKEVIGGKNKDGTGKKGTNESETGDANKTERRNKNVTGKKDKSKTEKKNKKLPDEKSKKKIEKEGDGKSQKTGKNTPEKKDRKENKDKKGNVDKKDKKDKKDKEGKKAKDRELEEAEIDIDEASEKAKSKPEEQQNEKKTVSEEDDLEGASGSGSGDDEDAIPDEYGDEDFSGDKNDS